jgi:hypothetical protein
MRPDDCDDEGKNSEGAFATEGGTLANTAAIISRASVVKSSIFARAAATPSHINYRLSCKSPAMLAMSSRASMGLDRCM